MRLSHVRAALAAAALLLVLPAGAAQAASPTVWLCKPGLASNPCTSSLDTTVIAADGTRRVAREPRRSTPQVDCFYVYPTVSGQDRVNASLRIDPEQKAIAQFQASRYNRTCRIFAPMYRQLTLRAINTPRDLNSAARNRAYGDVRDAWREYLRKHNKGRGVILVGHSQGTFMLRELIKDEIDRRAAERRRIVAAHLIGGNVLVRKGADRGGDFREVRACRSTTQIGCVVAYSMYGEEPPADSRFARSRDAKTEVLCTNPGALSGGSTRLDAFNRTAPFPGLLGVAVAAATDPPKASTPWVAYPGRSTGRCVKRDGAVWLQITPVAGDPRPTFRPVPDANWGLHLGDMNIALGELTTLAQVQARTWLRRAGR